MLGWIKFVFKSTLIVGKYVFTISVFVFSFDLIWILLIDKFDAVLKLNDVGMKASTEIYSFPESSKSTLSNPTIASS